MNKKHLRPTDGLPATQPRDTPFFLFKKNGWFYLAAALILALSACHSSPREIRFSGKTMGTTYHITLITGQDIAADALQQKIDARLAAINKSMSTFDPDSELSRFNAAFAGTSCFSPSADFLHVLRVATELYRLTDGAWDGTLDPLINLWGFGKAGVVHEPPDDARIREMLDRVGFDRIILDESGCLRKTDPRITLDLASIAKGYGVDAISRLLGDAGVEHFIVEIGGEVYARGVRSDGTPWQVGINRPDKIADTSDIYAVVPLVDQAMATSGDYRIFFRTGDQAYSHILDPRTGKPVANNVVSVSVVAANCTVADGLATALMVMGPEKGIALVNTLPDVACLIITRSSDGTLKNHFSEGFVMKLPAQRQ
ncbi:FAD:protein FMN transferase [Desulfosarcina sp. OttesenSCG-928-A07]|nr:FAD:protein FMN transferase [Desulfosarcina sp. OttesenSCG-928-G17]MDL2328743.1 FAD:protein FMN transferase [Desulfosarcina sp. OttesenSCG-928-A07]